MENIIQNGTHSYIKMKLMINKNYMILLLTLLDIMQMIRIQIQIN